MKGYLLEHSEYYGNIRNVYLYGAGFLGEKFLCSFNDLTSKLNQQTDFEVCFVDRNLDKQNCKFCGKSVISPEKFLESFCSGGNDVAIICLPYERGLSDVLNMIDSSECSNKFIHKINFFYGDEQSSGLFFTMWAYLRKTFLYFQHIGINTTSKCNLLCNGCLNAAIRRKKAYDVSFESFCRNLDSLFQLVDYVSQIVFGFGEDFLYEHLEQAIRYTIENYCERFDEIRLITNGTIILDDNVLSVLADKKIHVVLGDYRENVFECCETYPKVLDALKLNRVRVIELLSKKWYGEILSPPPTHTQTCVSEEDLTAHFDKCIFGSTNILYWGFKEESIAFRCLPSLIAYEFGDVEFDSHDYLDFSKCSKAQCVEFHLGFTEKGYLSVCEICNGVHNGVPKKWIPVAVQAKGKER